MDPSDVRTGTDVFGRSEPLAVEMPKEVLVGAACDAAVRVYDDGAVEYRITAAADRAGDEH